MATDTLAQRKVIYKSIQLGGKRNIAMTGDSIASRMADVSNLSSFKFKKAGNLYLTDTSISGSNIANYSGGDSAVWNPYSIASRSVAGATNAFNVDNYDILILWAGFNDKNDNIPIGAVSSTDSLTISGAIRNTYTNYLARNPNMRLMAITPNNNPYETNNSLGLNIVDYRNGIIAVCADLGIPCFDLWPESVCGITDANKATALPDSIHPTQTFLQTWAPLITTFISQNF